MTTSITRRGLGGLAAAGGALGLAPTWASANEGQEQELRLADRGRPRKRPNLLVVLADDLGWADLGCYGAPDIRTPNLDRLALSGIRFTDGYSASAVCSPTRFGLYTGRYPGRLPGGLQEPISSPNEIDGIPLDHPTLATLVKDAGYDTAMIGKWHCGYLPWFSPTRLGWDEFFGNFSGGIDYFSKINHNGAHDLYEDEVEVDDLRYYTDILTERATEFLRRDHDRPWLLNLNYTTPHWPWEGPDDKAVSRELTRRFEAGESRVLFHDDGGSREKYREMVEDLDRSIGKVLRVLEATGQREDTLVYFASDNGGERFSYNWPFSGAKGTTHEGGIRVPTILSWPGTLPRRSVSRTPLVSMDVTATLLDLAGTRPDPDHPLDGASLVPHLLRGRPAPRRDLFWRMRADGALRRGDLKFRRDADGDHLYDLSADTLEQADVARRRPEDVRRLAAAWEAIESELLDYP